MEMIYYTIAAVVLYAVSDYILNAIEIKRGERLPNRSLVFFAIILTLAVIVFSGIRALYQPDAAAPAVESSQPAPAVPD